MRDQIAFHRLTRSNRKKLREKLLEKLLEKRLARAVSFSEKRLHVVVVRNKKGYKKKRRFGADSTS